MKRFETCNCVTVFRTDIMNPSRRNEVFHSCNLALIVESSRVKLEKPEKPEKSQQAVIDKDEEGTDDEEDEEYYDDTEDEESSQSCEWRAILKRLHSPISTEDLKDKPNKDYEVHPITSRLILIKSNNMIDPKIGQQLCNLIKPFQKLEYNYRDSKFINNHWGRNSNEDKSKTKPKLQELIYQYTHWVDYKQLESLMKYCHIKCARPYVDHDEESWEKLLTEWKETGIFILYVLIFCASRIM